MATTPRLLLVEDDPDTASLMAETLADHFGEPCVRHYANVTDALTADLDGIDLVLSDMNLPDGTGLDVLEQYLQRRADLPVVLVTAEGVLANAMTAIQRGAYDYVVKTGDYLFAIPIVVEKNLATWRTKQENTRLQRDLAASLEEVKVKNQQLESAVARLASMAATDPLTGLANRRSLSQSLERAFADAFRHGHDLACVMIDLDNFKKLNDSMGHQAGDELLVQTAKVLEANCRRSDIAGRFGGDEFVLLLPQTGETTARQVANRVQGEFLAMAQRLHDQSHPGAAVGMSMGLALMSVSRPSDPEQLIAQADHALYHAKQAGKNRLAVYAGKRVGARV